MRPPRRLAGAMVISPPTPERWCSFYWTTLGDKIVKAKGDPGRTLLPTNSPGTDYCWPQPHPWDDSWDRWAPWFLPATWHPEHQGLTWAGRGCVQLCGRPAVWQALRVLLALGSHSSWWLSILLGPLCQSLLLHFKIKPSGNVSAVGPPLVKYTEKDQPVGLGWGEGEC